MAQGAGEPSGSAANSLCIVTSSLEGLSPPSASGAHCLVLARALAAAGARVTLLFTGEIASVDVERASRHLVQDGLTLVLLKQLPDPVRPGTCEPSLRPSYGVLAFVESQAFATVHFMSMAADAFACVRARRTLGAFADTRLVIAFDGTTALAADAEQHWYDDPIVRGATNWAELYAIAHADMVIAPSPEAAEMLVQRGWRSEEHLHILALCSADMDPALGAAWAARISEPPRRRTVSVPPARHASPRVTVCVPYFNYGRFVRTLLQSLDRQSFTDFEVVVIDDGSTDPHSIAVFDGLAADYPAPRHRFVRQVNQGIGATRNAAAALARGEFLVFMDSDNAALPHMLAHFVAAMDRTGDDVITCHFHMFDENDDPLTNPVILSEYLPLGPCVEIGWHHNIFGDANFIVRRTSFEAVGRFKTERGSSLEDWDLLARMALAGFRQDVVPTPLFLYRITPGGFSRVTNPYRNRRRVLAAYREALPPAMAGLAEIALVPADLRPRPPNVPQQPSALTRLRMRLRANPRLVAIYRRVRGLDRPRRR